MARKKVIGGQLTHVVPYANMGNGGIVRNHLGVLCMDPSHVSIPGNLKTDELATQSLSNPVRKSLFLHQTFEFIRSLNCFPFYEIDYSSPVS